MELVGDHPEGCEVGERLVRRQLEERHRGAVCGGAGDAGQGLPGVGAELETDGRQRLPGVEAVEEVPDLGHDLQVGDADRDPVEVGGDLLGVELLEEQRLRRQRLGEDPGAGECATDRHRGPFEQVGVVAEALGRGHRMGPTDLEVGERRRRRRQPGDPRELEGELLVVLRERRRGREQQHRPGRAAGLGDRRRLVHAVVIVANGERPPHEEPRAFLQRWTGGERLSGDAGVAEGDPDTGTAGWPRSSRGQGQDGAHQKADGESHAAF